LDEEQTVVALHVHERALDESGVGGLDFLSAHGALVVLAVEPDEALFVLGVHAGRAEDLLSIHEFDQANHAGVRMRLAVGRVDQLELDFVREQEQRQFDVDLLQLDLSHELVQDEVLKVLTQGDLQHFGRIFRGVPGGDRHARLREHALDEHAAHCPELVGVALEERH